MWYFQVLDCCSIVVVMVLSRLLLKTHYQPVHIIGVVVALFGLAWLIAADVISGRNEDSGGNWTLIDVINEISLSVFFSLSPSLSIYLSHSLCLALFGLAWPIATDIISDRNDNSGGNWFLIHEVSFSVSLSLSLCLSLTHSLSLSLSLSACLALFSVWGIADCCSHYIRQKWW